MIMDGAISCYIKVTKRSAEERLTEDRVTYTRILTI